MATRQLESLDLASVRVRSPRRLRIVEAAAYAGAERLDDGTRLRPPALSCSRESPAARLTPEQNERLAQQHAANVAHSSLSEPEAVVEARAGWRTIEIFVALLPVGWG